MLKYLSIFITAVITSFYYFPISFMVLPTVNTKLMLAVVGCGIFVINAVRKQNVGAKNDYISLFIFSLVFSLFCFFSVVFNETFDYAYATYFISMSVWLFGAYAVCQLVKKVHGYITIELIAHYLIVVCVSQCFLALLIDNIPSVQNWVDSIFWQDQYFLHKVKRLYGIGAMLDTAGIRFSVVLVLLTYLLTMSKNASLKSYLPLYIVSFLIIGAVGNMIARTTSVGVVVGIVYLLYSQFFTRNKNFLSSRIFLYIIVFLSATVVILTYLYHTNPAIHESIRFGFEGFFNFFEKGEWKVGSNEQLQSMVVFPDNFKTWLVGDGYFDNPVATDPYYVGKVMGGYYMGTDIGYCRFIFYCGILGLLAFSLFIWRAAALCANRFPYAKTLFYFFLLVHFVCWMKVSTDIFLIFALFIMMDKEPQEETNEPIVALS